MQFGAFFFCNGGNFAHGSYLTGEKGLKRRELFTEFLSKQSRDFFDELAEAVQFDRDDDKTDADSAKFSALDFLSAGSIRKRGVYVKNKGWFKLHAAVRALVYDWTIIQHALASMEVLGI